MAAGTGRAPDTQVREIDGELEAVALPRDEQIRRRAHEIWLERGCPSGSETEHWLAAEAEISGAIAG